MRTASEAFYLAFFAFIATSHAQGSKALEVCAVSSCTSSGKHNASHTTYPSDTSRYSAPFPSTHSPISPDCPKNALQIEPGAIVSDACASYSALDQLNAKLHPYIHSLTQKSDFFSFYRLNLFNKKCPFWSDESGLCGNIACAVNTIENEEDIPLMWRAEELGKLEGPKAQHPGKKQQAERQERPLQGELGDNVGESCVVEYDDECDERDYCVPEDESATAKGDYVSLVDNPERYTGYAGPSAHQVWSAIYRENCFSKPASSASAPQAEAAQALRSVMEQHGRQQAFVKNFLGEELFSSPSSKPQNPALQMDLEFEDSCIEKRVFHRVISGMHASISSHLCYDYLNQTTGKWGPNLACYESRIHAHPERVSNMYFNFALLSRAIAKIKPYLKNYTFCGSDVQQDRLTKKMMMDLVNRIPSHTEGLFDESVMFHSAEGVGLKQDFRNRFRNVSRIMDCVGCDKCRLWGKVQTNGYGTALKILFEFDDQDKQGDFSLRRTELVALVNTLDKISHSLRTVKELGKMIESRDAKVAEVRPGKPVSASEGNSEEEAGREWDDFDEQRRNDRTKAKHQRATPETFSEAFNKEFGRIIEATIWVLDSWYHLPGRLLNAFILEISRLWDYWLGVPVRHRNWSYRPEKDEL